jgi:putative membrane protein
MQLLALAALLLVRPAQPPETVHATDDDFVRFAVAGNMAEVELSQVAADHAASGPVRDFAHRMIADHDRAGKEIKAIADKRQFPVPTALDGQHSELKQKLLSLKGADFDRAFMDAMVDDHKKTVVAFRDEAEHGQDGEIKAYAARTLPTIEAHLKMAEQIDHALSTD